MKYKNITLLSKIKLKYSLPWNVGTLNLCKSTNALTKTRLGGNIQDQEFILTTKPDRKNKPGPDFAKPNNQPSTSYLHQISSNSQKSLKIAFHQ